MEEEREILEEDIISIIPNRIIKRIIEKEGLKQYTINQTRIAENGANYFGELYEVDIQGIDATGDKQLNLFVKNIVDDNESIKIISLKDAYINELFTYNELSKKYEELQEEANIPLEERYKMVKVYEGSKTDMLIMENIAKKGFKTYHRMDLVPLEFLELALKNIAKFHAMSFVLKIKESEFFNTKLKNLKSPLNFGEDYKEKWKNLSDLIIQNVEIDFKEKILKLSDNLVQKFDAYCNDDTIKTCICHGDYRPNNIMFKEEDGEIKEIISIDFQLVNYGCPVFDFLYLIYLCTNRSFRKMHMANLKDVYYNALDNYLKYFDLNANIVYPRKEFERVFEEKMDFGLLIVLQVLPFAFAFENELPDMAQSDDNFQVHSSFKERIQGIIEDFIELDFI